MWLGSGAGTYGSLTITGGAANVGSWLAVGRGGHGALNLTGGTLNVLTNNITLGTTPTGNSNHVANFGGSSITNVFGGSIFLPEQQNGVVAVANVSGSAVVNLGNNVQMGVTTGFTNTGVLNLNGGTLATKSIVKGAAGGTFLVNFNGGT